jgi:hypothetical protein
LSGIQFLLGFVIIGGMVAGIREYAAWREASAYNAGDCS